MVMNDINWWLELEKENLMYIGRYKVLNAKKSTAYSTFFKFCTKIRISIVRKVIKLGPSCMYLARKFVNQ